MILEPGRIFQKTLAVAVVSLAVAAPIISSHDPGRLSLLTGTGSLLLQLLTLILFLLVSIHRVIQPSALHKWDLLPLSIGLVGLGLLIASWGPERYARPGQFVFFTWVCFGCLLSICQHFSEDRSDSRALIHAVLASAISSAGLATYQELAFRVDWPSIELTQVDDPVLAGVPEFESQLYTIADGRGLPRANFDRPEGLASFLLLTAPVILVLIFGRSSTFWLSRARWILLPILLAGLGISLAASSYTLGNFRLLFDHPLWGVGPANSARHMSIPANSWSDLLVSGGIWVGGPVLLIALLLFRSWRVTAPEEVSQPVSSPRWVFYIGGGLGLLLGLIAIVNDIPAESPPHDVQTIAGTGVARAILWFVAFAILEMVAISITRLIQALRIGIVACLLFGFVARDTWILSVQYPLWVLVACAGNLQRGQPLSAGRYDTAWRILPVILGLILLTIFLGFAWLPGASTSAAVREARFFSRTFPEKHDLTMVHTSGPRRARAFTDAKGFVVANIINPMRQAVARDEGNAALRLELARWLRPLWHYLLTIDPTDAATVSREILYHVQKAAQLDPLSPAADKIVLESLLLFHSESKSNSKERLDAMNKYLNKIVAREPEREVPLRYRMAFALIEQKDVEGAQEQISLVLNMNAIEGQPHGSISDEQKTKLDQKLKDLLAKSTPPKPKEKE